MARPKKTFDYDLIEELASIMCTEEEIASICNCSVRTLQRDKEFCRVYKKGQQKGHESLRRKQWKLADTNSTMAIFLGKQYLGQTDDGRVDENNATEMTDRIKDFKIEIVDASSKKEK